MKRRLKKVLVSLCLMIVLVVTGLPTFSIPGVKAANGAEYVWFDVGWGDTYLAYDGSKAMLIDIAGGFNGKVADYLNNKGVKEIDYLVLTHGHDDHMGGVPAFLATSGIKVNNIVCDFGPNVRAQKYVDQMKDVAKQQGINIIAATQGLTVSTGSISCKVLLGRDPSETDQNSQSLVLKVNNCGKTLITMGDKPGQLANARVLPTCGSEMDADIWKMSHHGEEQGTTPEELQAITPSTVVYSSGKEITKASKDMISAVGAEVKGTLGNDIHIPVDGGVQTPSITPPVKTEPVVTPPATVVAAPADATDREITTDSYTKSKGPYSSVKLYSINNTLNNGYYKPKLAELPTVEGTTKEKLDITYVDTSRFDADWSDEYKPQGDQERALELLGYDMLLSNEDYNLQDKQYTVTAMGKNPTISDVIMSTYKALGICRYQYKYYVMDDRVSVKMFVTRSQPGPYLQKASKDLMYNTSNSGKLVTGKEFIKIVAEMMHQYGEPVMSEQEMNQLLQVYGAEMPTYLNGAESNAYLYLKSRGVLNVNMNLADRLTYSDMLDVLMCVGDKASRTDYKQIQLTQDVSEAMQNKGFYPKTQVFNVNDTAIDVETTYDYENAKYFDYFVEVNSSTKFKSVDGGEISTSLFIPSEPGNTQSVEMAGSQYCGIENDCYHFRIPILSADSAYMASTGGYYQINTKVDSDLPLYIMVEPGGGYYKSFTGDGKTLVGYRAPFQTSDSAEYVDMDRKTSSAKQARSEMSFGEKVVDNIRDTYTMLASFLMSNVYAADVQDSNQILSSVSVKTSATTERGTIGLTEEFKALLGNVEVSPDSKTVTFTTDPQNVGVGNAALYQSAAFQNVSSKTSSSSSTTANTSYQLLTYTNLNNITLVRYSDLVSAGICAELDDNRNYDDGVYEFYTTYGDVRVNTNKNEIVVGNVVYSIVNADGTPLVQEDGDDLLVDYRIAFGWSYGMVDMTQTGTSSTSAINVRTIQDLNGSMSTVKVGGLKRVMLKDTIGFRSKEDTKRILTLDKKALGGDGVHERVLLSTSTGTSNFVILEKNNPSTGNKVDMLFTYYPEDAVTQEQKDQIGDNFKNQMIATYGAYVEVPNSVLSLHNLSENAQNINVPGQVYYHDGLGWVYTVPDMDTDGSLEKYLSGEYWLPYFERNGKIYDFNFNSFEGYPYGTRPGPSGEAVQWDGNIIDLPDATSSPDCDITAAPVGVSTFFGRSEGAENGVVIREAMSSKVADWINNDKVAIMYGSSKVTSIYQAQANTWSYSITYAAIPGHSWSTTVDTGNSGVFYRTQKRCSGKDASNENKVQYTWVMLGKNTAVSTIDGDVDLSVVGAENKDKYKGFEAFSFKYTLDKVDSFLTLMMYITFTIIPLLIFIALTILLGFSMIADINIVKILCNKTIDPVKILTFGRVTIEEYTFKQAFIGLMIGYLSVFLLLNGNVFALLQLLSKWITAISEVIRNL